MNTATEQVPAVAQATEMTPAVPVSGEGDNLTGAQLLAAFKARRAAPPTPSAVVEPRAETKPAVSATPEAPAPDSETATDEPSQAASTPETEAGAEPAAEGVEAAAPEAEAHESNESRGIQEMKARIDKLTARLRDAERKAAEQAKAAPEQAQPVAVKVAGDFGRDPEVASMSKDIEQFTNIRNWAIKNPDGGFVADGKGGQVEISAEEALSYRTQAEDRLSELRAARASRVGALRAQVEQVTAQNEAHISQTFAWAKQEASQQNEVLRMIDGLLPAEVKNAWPGWKLVTAYGLEGITKAGAKPVSLSKPAAKPPKVAPAQTATPPRVNPASKALSEAEAAYEKHSSANNLKRVLALRRESRLAAA